MNPLVSLAKTAVENYIKERKVISSAENLPEEFLKKQAGTFVTILKKQGEKSELRGCIGTYLPAKKNIAEEVIYNAIAAAADDYRFGPIQEDEFPKLSYVVYILSEPEFILTKEISDSLELFFQKVKTKLDPKKFGIIVKTHPILSLKNLNEQSKTNVIFNGHFIPKSGLLLPDIEGIDTIEKQVFIACQKADIDLTKEKILIYRFSVEQQKNGQ